MKFTRLVAASFCSLAMLAAHGQEKDKSSSKNKDEPKRERPSFNIEEYRKKAAERIKQGIDATDEEWTVLQPLIENVMNRQRDAYTGRSMSGRSFGSSSSSSSESPRPGQVEAQSLQAALENESTSLEEVKSKLSALRDVRKRAQAALAQARDELRKVLSVRQEAALVAMGIME